MKKYGLIGLMLVVVVVATGVWYAGRSAGAPTGGPVDVRIQIGSASATIVTVPGDATALEATRAAAEVTTEGEGEMAFVSAIDGVAADASRREFWKLLINDEEALVGAGSYTVRQGDALTWEIDTF